MVEEHTTYSCSVCYRRYNTKAKAEECEQKEPYPADFVIGDTCIILLSDGHKDNAYLCEVTGIELKEHRYARRLRIVKEYAYPYHSEYILTEDDIKRYGAH